MFKVLSPVLLCFVVVCVTFVLRTLKSNKSMILKMEV